MEPWYHGLYPGVKVFGVRYLEASSDRLLCFGICYKSLARQVLLKGAPTDGNLCAPNRQLDSGVVAALMPGGCEQFRCILHAVLWTYLCVLVFSNRLHFVHTSSQFFGLFC